MKKYLVAFLAFLLLFVGMWIGVQASAMESSDEVIYTEHTIFGDAGEIDGIELELAYQCDRHLFWNIDLTLGEELLCDADFSTAYNNTSADSTSTSSFDLSYGLNGFGASSSGDILAQDDYFFGQRAMVEDVVSRTPAGEKHTETVRIADYYDFYPVSAYIRIGNLLYMDMDNRADYSDRIYGDITQQFYEKLNEVFRIPVMENDKQVITIQKRSDGTVSEVDSHSADENYVPYIESTSVIAEDAIYFTYLPNLAASEKLGDNAGTNAWGIYRIPYALRAISEDNLYYSSSKEYVDLMLDAFEMVYPLEQGVRVEAFGLSEDESVLYLTTRHPGEGEDTIMLTVVERETMTEQQSTKLFSCSPEDYVMVHSYHEDFILYKIAYEKFAVVENVDGIWQTAFVVEDATITDYWSNQEYVTFSYGTVADYDGERLAIVGYSNEYGGNGKTSASSYLTSFYLSIYSEKGQLYTGKFTSSLDTGTFLTYREICKPIETSSTVLRLP